MEHDIPNPIEAENVVYNPPPDTLRSFSAAMETTTEYGSPSYVTDVRSRSGGATRNAVDHEFTDDDRAEIRRAQERLREDALVCVDRRLGRHPDHSFVCRLFVPKAYGRIALSLTKLFDPAEEGAEPDFVTVQLPDRDEPLVRIFPEEGITYSLGTDYTGGAKKSFLRLFMYRAKQRGGLGLHAGTKRVTVAGDADPITQLYVGLSGTGKTVLTAHGFWFDDPERAALVQDDVCAILPDGTVAGSEGGGMFVKTDDLSPDEQPELYHAATRPEALLENVSVAPDGAVDFADESLTTNGRAVVRRADVPTAEDDLDVANVDQVFIVTRNPLAPPVAKLTPTEAAAAFVLGESVETSAGDPERAGESIRVVGTNPYFVGSASLEATRFLEFVEESGPECFLVNTGEVGTTSPKPVEIADTVAILAAISRGTIEWTDDDTIGHPVAASVPGLDVDAFYPPDRVEDYADRLAALRAERRSYLEGFEDLPEELLTTTLTE